MDTKQMGVLSSVLAKIHMVTKLTSFSTCSGASSVLAKIHMVTKLNDQNI